MKIVEKRIFRHDYLWVFFNFINLFTSTFIFTSNLTILYRFDYFFLFFQGDFFINVWENYFWHFFVSVVSKNIIFWFNLNILPV